MLRASLVSARSVLLRGGVVVFASACLVAAAAAQGPSMTPATEQAIRSYILDQGKADTILKTMKELSTAMQKDPDFPKKIGPRMKLPLEQQWKAMETDPVSGPVLKASRMSADQYSCGLLALRAASGLDTGAGVARLANPANVAFLKANPSIVERLKAIDMGK
jgi:hypothetical protein